MSKSRQGSKLEQEPAREHDGAYRDLFTHPDLIEDLLRHFVKESPTSLADMVEEVPSGLARYPTIPRML